jgi:hypothetical protein
VKKFQEKKGLTVDGKPGPQTLNTLAEVFGFKERVEYAGKDEKVDETDVSTALKISTPLKNVEVAGIKELDESSSDYLKLLAELKDKYEHTEGPVTEIDTYTGMMTLEKGDKMAINTSYAGEKYKVKGTDGKYYPIVKTDIYEKGNDDKYHYKKSNIHLSAGEYSNDDFKVWEKNVFENDKKIAESDKNIKIDTNFKTV